MRRRLLLSIMGTVLVVIVAFGAPLAIVGARLVREEADRRLQREADAVALSVESSSGSIPSTLSPLVSADTRVLLIDATGHPTLAAGPAEVHGPQVVAESATDRGGVVRLEAPAEPTDQRVRRIWAVIAVAALGGAALSLVMAIVMSRRLSRPLDDLAEASARLGAGDFRARAAHSGVREMDAVADRLNASTEQLARLVERERHFSVNASHQLRTALTALRIPLEELSLADDRDEVRHLTGLMLHQADRLQSTIEELLALAHGQRGVASAYAVDSVIAERAAVWGPVLARQGRALQPGPPVGALAMGSSATLRQVLDVLIDNANVHGAGDVMVAAHVSSGSPVVRVSDEGPGIAAGHEQRIFERGTSFGRGRGVGLAVARDLLSEEGGRLVLARARPAVFEVFLPRVEVTEPLPAGEVALARP